VASLLLSMIGGWTYTCVNIVYHPAALVSSINKTDFRNRAEIMFKFPLKSHITTNPICIQNLCCPWKKLKQAWMSNNLHSWKIIIVIRNELVS
jgi:hypothetical protein